MLTTPIISARRLGATATLTVPTRVLVLFSGNHVAIAGDMNRRVLKVNILPADKTSPWGHGFGFDPVHMTRQNRHNMVIAALTLIKWNMTSQEPFTPPNPFGSFEDWSRMVRDTVVRLGMADAVETIAGN